MFLCVCFTLMYDNTQTKTQNNTDKTFSQILQEFMNECKTKAKKNIVITI
ncbi:hypothetical protein SUNDANCE_185 [Brevibacillus phage Sundance]|nr:hypothetical protein AVT09_gp185 [Brevibacillus phage Sundance]ALA48001.1 hypothetical protein SUNDANCE_185 [Brevibacillus phage Sundance]